jgi:hypothetical protein
MGGNPGLEFDWACRELNHFDNIQMAPMMM